MGKHLGSVDADAQEGRSETTLDGLLNRLSSNAHLRLHAQAPALALIRREAVC